MRNFYLAAFCAVALAACGGGEKDEPDITVGADANTTNPVVDGGNTDICNPVTQAGCAPGEKCAQVVSSTEPFLAAVACVANGEVTEGGPCTDGEPGATTGFDDCAAGYSCLRGVCTEICTTVGDTCRTADDVDPFMGNYCTLYADLFSDETGLCVPACNPTDDSTAGGVVTNAQCGEGNGCYFNIGRGIAGCAGTPEGAAGIAQNGDCYGPSVGTCYLNGCPSGFAPILPNDLGAAATTGTCSRYCSPVDTYMGSVAGIAGADGKCGIAELTALGGTAPKTAEAHQCRFVQSLYGEPLDPATVGMCVPRVPWYDCSTFTWTQIKEAIAGAANEMEADTAFNDLCLVNPDDPESDLTPGCDGIGFGCVSLAERELGLTVPGTFSKPSWIQNRIDNNIPLTDLPASLY